MNTLGKITATRTPPKKQMNESVLLVETVTGNQPNDRAAIISSIKAGLKYKTIESFEKVINASQKEVGELLLISQSTLTRRKKDGHLTAVESDRLIRFARIVDSAVQLMNGNGDAASTWLRTPIDILSNKTPLEHSKTELGSRDVEGLIGRLSHGARHKIRIDDPDNGVYLPVNDNYVPHPDMPDASNHAKIQAGEWDF